MPNIEQDENLEEDLIPQITDRMSSILVLVMRADKKSQSLSWWSVIFKLMNIILGATAASTLVVDNSMAPNMAPFLALLITIIAGIDAAFKFETLAVNIRVRAAKWRKYHRIIESKLTTEIDSSQTFSTQTEARLKAQELLLRADKLLSKAQREAAELGISAPNPNT